MKFRSACLILSLCCLSSYGQEVVSPFSPRDPGNKLTEGADVDPFDHLNQNAGESDAHRLDDQIVNLGNGNGLKYITIGGWFDKKKDQFTVLFRVDVKQYNDSLKHPENNRGVGLMSGPQASPDFYCWLRPFHITEKTADFIVIFSKKNTLPIYLAFIPREGHRRYLYDLKQATEAIAAKEQKK